MPDKPVNCENYSEVWNRYFARTHDIDWRTNRDKFEEIGRQVHSEEKWVPITYDMLIQIGYDWINSKEYFTQQGKEGLRDNFSPKFWECWSLITGVVIDNDAKNQNPFSCTC